MRFFRFACPPPPLGGETALVYVVTDISHQALAVCSTLQAAINRGESLDRQFIVVEFILNEEG